MTDDTVPPSKPPNPPFHTPGYRVREALAGSPRHATWRATRVHDARPVVLKIPLAPQPTSLDIARLHHEVEITGMLPESAVVRALAVERWDNAYALVADDLGGDLLAKNLSARIPVRTVLELGRNIAGAVAAVHARGVITRTSARPASSSIARTTSGSQISGMRSSSPARQRARLRPEWLRARSPTCRRNKPAG